MTRKLLLFICFVLSLQFLQAASLSLPVDTLNPVAKTATGSKDFLSNDNVKKIIGRKLTLKEKIGLAILRKNVSRPQPKNYDEKANTKALIGSILSIVGFFVFPLLLIPGYIMCKDVLKDEEAFPGTLSYTNKILAKIGKVLPIVYVILIVIAIIIILALIASLR